MTSERIPIPMSHVYNLRQNGWSYEAIAEYYGVTESGIRGMLSRYVNGDQPVKEDYGFAMPEVERLTRSEERMLDIVVEGQKKWFKLQAAGRPLVGLFLSDLHWPYADERAMSLILQVVEQLQPDWITMFNDQYDFPPYGRWGDNRSAVRQLWDADLQNALDLQVGWMKRLDSLIHKPWMPVALWGNHDVWLFEWLNRQSTGASVYTAYNVMRDFADMGIVFTGLPDRKQIIDLNRNLVMAHGWSASQNPGTVAKKMIADCTLQADHEDTGKSRSVIYGHDHRTGVFRDNGAIGISSGCNCTFNMPYLAAPPKWQWGITPVYYEPGPERTFFTAEPLEFKTEGRHLAVSYNGNKLTS